MPIDPTISLHAAAPANANPLAFIGQYAAIQNALNQNRLFQQTFAARQRAGALLSQAPDMETGLKALQTDPLTAPFAPEIANSIRQYELTNTQIAGEQQKQGTDVFNTFLKGMPEIARDPSTFGAVAQSALSLAQNPQARAGALNAINSLRTALIGGVPEGPEGNAIVQRRLAGMLTAAGVTGQAYDSIVGSPLVQDVGGQVLTGVQAPVVGSALAPGGGGFQASTAIGKTLAPTVTAPAQVVVGGGAAPPLVEQLGGAGAPGGALMPQGAGAAPGPGAALMPAGGASRGWTGGMSPGEVEAAKGIGKQAADIQTGMQNAAAALPDNLKQLDTITGALGQFQAGGGASTRASVAQMAQALKNVGLPITDDDINAIGNSSLPATQLFQKYISKTLTQELKQDATGSSTRIKSEVDAYLKMMSSSTDPRALLQMLNNMRYHYQLDYDRTQKWPQFKAAVQGGQLPGYDMSDFYSWYDKNLANSQLPKATPWGAGLGPTPASAIKGAAPASAAAPTLQYVPGKGLVPIK